MPTLQLLTGQVFGQLTVIELNRIDPKGQPVWRCRCTCGNIKSTAACNLTSGSARANRAQVETFFNLT